MVEHDSIALGNIYSPAQHRLITGKTSTILSTVVLLPLEDTFSCIPVNTVPYSLYKIKRFK
jgi:hypothetical protein